MSGDQPPGLHALCALVDAPPAASVPRGEALRFVSVEGLSVALYHLEPSPLGARAPSSTLEHAAVIEALCTSCRAVLPFPFGTVVGEVDEVLDVVLGARGALAEALGSVRDRVQMTLRVYGDPQSEGLGAERFGTGQWVARCATSQLPELATLAAPLAPVVRAQRLEHHVLPPLLASVYHLVDREDLGRYANVLASNTEGLHEVTVMLTGPGPAYAFAPSLAR